MKMKEESKIKEWWESLKEDANQFYEDHPFIAGHIVVTVLIYWVLVIGSIVQKSHLEWVKD